MSNILARVARRRRLVPETIDEFFALQVGRRLGDTSSLREYMIAGAHSSAAGLLAAYRVVKASKDTITPAGPAPFRAAVQTLVHRRLPDATAPLIAFRVTRRRIAAAVFTGLKLEYIQVRELATQGYQAKLSTLGFVREITDQFPKCTLVVEEHHGKAITQSGELTRTLIHCAETFGIPLIPFDRRSLFEAYSEPACASRAQFRDVVSRIFPALMLRFRHRLVFDAAGLGLYAQVFRLLNQEQGGPQ